MRYRRVYAANATYFFTVVTFRRRPVFDELENITFLRQAFSEEMVRRPFQIDAIVIMPDHIHTVWTLPKNDANYSIRWRNIKSGFTKKANPALRSEPSASRKHKKEQAIWQRRFWEHRIRNETDFENHVHYIHYNPVKHGYVERPRDWPYSSIHRHVKHGLVPADWGCHTPPEFFGSAGME